MSMPTADELKLRIESAIPGAEAVVTAAAFEGQNRVQQHRLVYAAFEPGELGGTVHALQLKTEVP